MSVGGAIWNSSRGDSHRLTPSKIKSNETIVDIDSLVEQRWRSRELAKVRKKKKPWQNFEKDQLPRMP